MRRIASSSVSNSLSTCCNGDDVTIIPAVSSLSLTTAGITKPLFVSCASDAMGVFLLYASSDEREDVLTVNVFNASVVIFDDDVRDVEDLTTATGAGGTDIIAVASSSSTSLES